MTEKRFTLVDDYLIEYDGSYFDLHKPSDIRSLVTVIGYVTDENEQLKQYIYDNLDEDICDVCSYQYLEKSQMDKYYVAKCKKGYDNCSKGTVIHCNDFKFKELQE